MSGKLPVQDDDVSDNLIEHLIGSAPARLRERVRVRRPRRWVVLAGVFALMLVAAAVAVLTVPLPVSLVAPRITAAIGSRLGPGYDVSIGHARIDHSGDGIGFRLDDFAISAPLNDLPCRTAISCLVRLIASWMRSSSILSFSHCSICAR